MNDSTPRQPTRAANPEADTLDFARAAARIIDENKGENISVLNLRGLSNLADYFVIATGTSGRQMRAITDAISEFALQQNRKPFSRVDRGGTDWVLVDYVDVVIHLFDQEHRDYYDLDGLWGDAPRINWAPNHTDTSQNNIHPQ